MKPVVMHPGRCHAENVPGAKLAAYLEGVGLLVAREAGPRAAFRTGWQQAPRMGIYRPNPDHYVNVVLYKHVYYRNVCRYR